MLIQNDYYFRNKKVLVVFPADHDIFIENTNNDQQDD